mgnify:CR=1 FL=1
MARLELRQADKPNAHRRPQYESGEVFAARGRNEADAARLLPEDEAVESPGEHSHPLRVGRREPLQQALLMAHVTHTSEPPAGLQSPPQRRAAGANATSPNRTSHCFQARRDEYM